MIRIRTLMRTIAGHLSCEVGLLYYHYDEPVLAARYFEKCYWYGVYIPDRVGKIVLTEASTRRACRVRKLGRGVSLEVPENIPEADRDRYARLVEECIQRVREILPWKRLRPVTFTVVNQRDWYTSRCEGYCRANRKTEKIVVCSDAMSHPNALELLAHEYAHALTHCLVIGISPLPFWLVEGIALYVDSQCVRSDNSDEAINPAPLILSDADRNILAYSDEYAMSSWDEAVFVPYSSQRFMELSEAVVRNYIDRHGMRAFSRSIQEMNLPWRRRAVIAQLLDSASLIGHFNGTN